MHCWSIYSYFFVFDVQPTKRHLFLLLVKFQSHKETIAYEARDSITLNTVESVQYYQ